MRSLTSNGSRPPSRKPTNSATARNTSSNHLRLQKADAPSFSSKQSSHQTKRNNKKLPSTGFKQQPICTPLAPTRNQIIYKTASSDGPNSGSGKHSQNRLRSKGPPYRGGPHMRSLISIDFPAPEMEPESAHVASAVSVP